jgi:hypothetical protein
MMKNMTNHIINTIKALIKYSEANEKSMVCNYSDNYYGDQICQ